MAISFAPPERLESLPDIQRHARGSLSAAGALGTFPVPLADVAGAVNLRRQDLFSLGKDLPPSLKEIAAKLKGNVLGLLNIQERTMYVDSSLPNERRRFTEGHEIGHDALPWHNAAYFGDDLHTLAADTKDLLEREANAFSAELIFGAGHFVKQAAGYAPGLAVPLSLARQYESSSAAALRYYVDSNKHPVALIVTGRFARVRATGSFLPVFRQQCAQSASFTDRYGDLHGLVPNELPLESVAAARILHGLERGPGETTEFELDTARGAVKFHGETFSNTHLRFLMIYKVSRLDGRKLKLVSSSGRPL